MRFTALLLLAAAAAPAAAQSADTNALVACAAKPDDAERLACYDAAVAAIGTAARAAVAAREAAAAQARTERAAAEARAAAERTAAAERARRETFGGEALPTQRAAAAAERLDELETTVGETLLSQNGATVFLLENGQMWRQTEAMPLPPIKRGAAVTIKRAAMGSYRLVIPSIRRAVVVRRER